MHIIHNDIGLPMITSKSLGDNLMEFIISPLPNGYGMTLGNSLRRVLLSSIPGSAITAVRIDGVSHEYTTVKGLKDSVLDFCLNLKKVIIKKHSKDIEFVSLSKKTGDILAGDIAASSDIEILNNDFVISTLGKGVAGLKAEIKIQKGIGYLPAEQQQENADEENWIYLDATYSPVTKVFYEVKSTRVGDNTNLDKLIIQVETNGSIDPESAMKFAANVLESYFNLFQKDKEDLVEADFVASIDSIKSNRQAGENEFEEEEAQENYTPVEILNLSPRTLNSLINGGIGSVEELVECTPAKLENLKGFGKKAMTEVADALSEQKLSLSAEE